MSSFLFILASFSIYSGPNEDKCIPSTLGFAINRDLTWNNI